MKDYFVSYPFAGALNFNVEADSEEEAKRKCWELLEKCMEDGKDPMREFESDWEMLDKIVEGNVCYAPNWYVEVEEA